MIKLKKLNETENINELNLDGYKHIKNNDWNIPENLIKWLNNNNFSLIGKGVYSFAYQSKNNNFIIKINKGKIDEGYLKFVDFCHQNKGNPHLPKMGQIKKYDDWYIIFIEKLEPINVGEEYYLHKMLADLVNKIIFSKYLEDNDDKDMFTKIAKKVFYSNVLPPIFDNDNNKNQLIEILFLLFKFKVQFNINQSQFDVHFGNIMLRGKTFVITDPVV